MSASLRQRVLELLGEHHVVTLATCGTEGLWAAAVFYAHDDLTLYFLSSPKSRHGLDIGEGAAVAATIQRDYDDWPGIRGLQLKGRAEPVNGDAELRARQLYGQRFPVVGLAGKAPAAIVQALSKVRWYAFRPTSVWLIDNRRGFGHREQLELAADCR